MVHTGLDVFLHAFPSSLQGARLGILCHAASITREWVHILDALAEHPACSIGAIFGPQHGLFGQTQDNMIEWEGERHAVLNIPVYSLYGQHRKPTPAMLNGIDALCIDLQDVGARPYTYFWTVKLCLEACRDAGIPVWILDRPNPVSVLCCDGPMLDPAFFSFVGGAQIPLCHGLTIGELSLLLRTCFFPTMELHVVKMGHWRHGMQFSQTGLPWVLPSPNMPTVDTALVYPGMVLYEGTNLSEGRGTTRPFEIMGAPFLDNTTFTAFKDYALPGCVVRWHDFIPSFQKWSGSLCRGVQIHVTNPAVFRPVATAVAFLRAVMETASSSFEFKQPPYEYETEKLPFDILAGSSRLRAALESGMSLNRIDEQWREERRDYSSVFKDYTLYPDTQS